MMANHISTSLADGRTIVRSGHRLIGEYADLAIVACAAARAETRANRRDSDAGGALVPRYDLEGVRLETLDHLAETRDALLVAGEPAPVPYRGDALPRPEAHVRLRVLEIAKQERLRLEARLAAPVDPFAPALDELRLP